MQCMFNEIQRTLTYCSIHSGILKERYYFEDKGA